MKTRIIAAFPGTGKTKFAEGRSDVLDSDSSGFSWWMLTSDPPVKERNPMFPGNYISYIKENVGKKEFILVSTHKEVREALLDNCLFYYLIYPQADHKDIYLKRYADRGNDQSFIDVVDKNWESWLHNITFDGPGCKHIEMVFPFLDREIRHIVASEGGDRIGQ